MHRLLLVTTVAITQKSFLLDFVKYFKNQGMIVEGASSGIGSCEDCKKVFDSVYEIGFSRNVADILSNFAAFWKIRGLLRTGNYDIIHVHTPVAGFVTRLARATMWAPQFKIVYTVHGFHFHSSGKWFQNILFRLLEKGMKPYTDALIVINKEDLNSAVKSVGFARDKVRYFPGIGVDISKYQRGSDYPHVRNEVRKTLNISDLDYVFVMLAEFVSNKSHLTMISALQKIRESNIKVVFAGTGPLLVAVKSLVTQNGLSDKVRFLGFRSDVRQLLWASDALVLISHREGLPRSIMEAFAASLPVIGTDIRGIRDLVMVEMGCLISVNDAKELALKMEEFSKNGKKIDTSSNVYSSLMNQLSIENILRLHDELYRQLL